MERLTTFVNHTIGKHKLKELTAVLSEVLDVINKATEKEEPKAKKTKKK